MICKEMVKIWLMNCMLILRNLYWTTIEKVAFACSPLPVVIVTMSGYVPGLASASTRHVQLMVPCASVVLLNVFERVG
jgi:hypothetical protein